MRIETKLQALRVAPALLIAMFLCACLCQPAAAQSASSPGVPGTPGTPAPAAAGPRPASPIELPPGLHADVMAPVERLAKSVETAEKAIKQLNALEGELARLREEVERIIYDSTATADALRPQLAEVNKQIQRLGPPPPKDKPPESSAIAAERERLNQMSASFDGAIKTTELAWVRAKQLIDRITVIRYQIFARNLLERRDSPLLPGVWRDVADRMDAVMGRLAYYGGDWLTWAVRVSNWLAGLGVAVVLAYALIRIVVARVLAVQLRRPEPQATFFSRVAQAVWIAPLRMLAPVAAFLAIYFGLAALDLLFSPWTGVADTAITGLLVYISASAIIWVSFKPHHPAWRLVPVDDRTAGRIALLLKAFVAVYVLDIILLEFGRALYVPLSVTVAHSFLISVTSVVILLALFATPFVPQTGPDRPVNGHAFIPGPVTLLAPVWLKLPLLSVATLILGASITGYIALGRFVAHQVVLTGTVLAAGGLVYLAIRAATRGRSDNRDLIGNALERRFGFTETGTRRQISRLVEVLLTLILVMLALPALLLQWGFSGADIRDWVTALLFGFEIGQFRFSLVRILIGIGLFTGLLFATRMIQRWLRDRVLTQPRIDAGIANSVETAVGYAGVALALLIALSWAGLDITSLAIVAGALSVGIGFGLQSIVNNFVSGLILLVERPIKVGDWIVVGNEQGNVRRISVRSTEIETFDKASLIVPNSELIAGRVLNWTHRNPLGRAVVKIEVAPDADPEIVLDLLRNCTRNHQGVLETPAPFITFDSFSATSLDFTVRSVVADVYTSGRIATELRIAILKALRQAGIQSPNPQYDVTLKDLDWVKSAAQRVAAQRPPTREMPPPVPAGNSNDNT